MATINSQGVGPSGSTYLITFPVVVVGGTGSYTFVPSVPNGAPMAANGRVYHRQITPPNNAGAYVCYVQNGLGIAHDYHSVGATVGTTATDINDEALWSSEVAFYIVNAATDGTYQVTLWIL